jgi:recombination protein RecR
MFSPLTEKLIDALRCLPGVGPKSAQRIAFHLLKQAQRSKGLHLSSSMQQALEHVGECKRCNTYTEETLCTICQNPKRNPNQLCILETPADIVAIEQTHSYNGVYHVLHGHLSPLDGIGPDEIGIPNLLQRLTNENINEIIIATNPTMEGKATAHYIASQLNDTTLKISQLAYGVPLGGEIEYLDGHTLAHALQTRLPFKTTHSQKTEN